MTADAEQSAERGRSLGDVLRAGLGWGVVFALLLPFAVAWLVIAGDSVGAGAGSSGGAGTSGAPRPRRALQYWITAATTVVLVCAALGGVVLYERWRNHV